MLQRQGKIKTLRRLVNRGLKFGHWDESVTLIILFAPIIFTSFLYALYFFYMYSYFIYVLYLYVIQL